MNRRTLQYPSSTNNTNRAWIRFKQIYYQWDTQSETGITRRPGQTVYLYLPGSIQVSDGASYASANLGIIGSSVESAIAGGALQSPRTGALGEMMEFGGQLYSDLVQTGSELFGGSNVNPALLIKAMQKTRLGGTPIGQGVQSGVKMAVNPHVRSLFENVGVRSFSFEFDLVPNNASEAAATKDIVKFFRKSLYPSYADDSSGLANVSQGTGITRVNAEGEAELVGLVYQYPPQLQVDMFYEMRTENANRAGLQEIGGNTLEQFSLDLDDSYTLVRVGPKLLPMHITGVSTTFDSGGAFAFRPDGSPISTKISVSVSEDRTLVASDIERGY